MEWFSKLVEPEWKPEGVFDEIPTDVDIVCLFTTPQVSPHFKDLVAEANSLFPDAIVVGTMGAGVAGGSSEVENRPAIAVQAARLPGVKIESLYVEELADVDFFSPAKDLAGIMVIADAFTIDDDKLVSQLCERFSVPIFGALSSGGHFPGAQRLFAEGEVKRRGAIVVSFSGPIEIDTIVARGCDPIGDPLIVKRVQENLILEFEEGRPDELLAKFVAALPEDRQILAAQSMFLGIEVRASGDGIYHRDDFLIHHLLGVDPNSGAVSIDSHLQPGQLVQFHLHDVKTSRHDLTVLFDKYRATEKTPSGGFMFSCIGRGEGLFGEPSHDIKAFQEHFPVPLGGFFGQGEIGPVGGKSFVHAYTTMFALFRDR